MGPTEAEQISIPSIPSEASKLQARIMARVRAFDYSADAQFAVQLALDEAFSNAIRHGNREDPDKQVHVMFEINHDRVAVTVEDEGPGFSPEDVPDPTLKENIEQPHGRGIMLMRAYMTQVQYNDAGNRITMVKRRGCSLPHAP